jgi:hypothetical protein
VATDVDVEVSHAKGFGVTLLKITPNYSDTTEND